MTLAMRGFRSGAAGARGSGLLRDYSPAVTFAAGVILVLAIGVIDKLTGYDLHLGVLYLLPITMVTWSAGLRWGLALSLGHRCAMARHLQRRASLQHELLLLLGGRRAVRHLRRVVLLTAKPARGAARARALSCGAGEARRAGVCHDLQRDEVLLGNREFRATFHARSAAELAR